MRPKDIAFDVRDQLCIDDACKFRDGCGCTDTIAAAIEAAVLAERERAARCCDQFDAHVSDSDFVNGQATAAQQIAAAIRAGGSHA